MSGAACDTGLPGTELGTYAVTGQLQTSTCGGTPPNPWSFDVEMSRQGTTLYWSWLDGSPLLSGGLSASSSASLTASVQSNVDGLADGGLGPCWIERDDVIAVTLASSSPPSTFTGSVEYTFSAVSGTDCSDQLALGNYAALPCSLTYTVSAARQ
jgi:hypothetical protein